MFAIVKTKMKLDEKNKKIFELIRDINLVVPERDKLLKKLGI